MKTCEYFCLFSVLRTSLPIPTRPQQKKRSHSRYEHRSTSLRMPATMPGFTVPFTRGFPHTQCGALLVLLGAHAANTSLLQLNARNALAHKLPFTASPSAFLSAKVLRLLRVISRSLGHPWLLGMRRVPSTAPFGRFCLAAFIVSLLASCAAFLFRRIHFCVVTKRIWFLCILAVAWDIGSPISFLRYFILHSAKALERTFS